MGKKKSRKTKQSVQFYAGQLSDFGTPERRLHDLVVIGDHSDSWQKTVKQARVLAPIELYSRRGLLSFERGDVDENELHLKAGERFSRLYAAQKSAIDAPRIRDSLAIHIGGGTSSGLYAPERDAEILKEYRNLKAYLGAALFPYLEDVAGKGLYAESACSIHHCTSNQFMHTLRLALRECVKFWGM